MTTKADYTADEWQTIMQAPMAATMLVMAASPSGPIGLVQETFAISKMLASEAQTPSGNRLIGAVAAEMKDAEGRKEAAPPRPPQGADMNAIAAQALATLQRLNDVLAAKAPADEAASFKGWLVTAARNVAAAAKEGSTLGFGGAQVTPEETAAVQQIAATLGVSESA